MRIHPRFVVVACAALALAWPGAAPVFAADDTASPTSVFGPNVTVFDPSMPQSQIQADFDAISSLQVPNQFGTQRYALLFKPGTYGSASNPLVLQMGYYMTVAGLGLSPNDVVINGAIVSF